MDKLYTSFMKAVQAFSLTESSAAVIQTAKNTVDMLVKDINNIREFILDPQAILTQQVKDKQAHITERLNQLNQIQLIDKREVNHLVELANELLLAVDAKIAASNPISRPVLGDRHEQVMHNQISQQASGLSAELVQPLLFERLNFKKIDSLHLSENPKSLLTASLLKISEEKAKASADLASKSALAQEVNPSNKISSNRIIELTDLAKISSKTDGKNISPVNGVYLSKEQKKYFVKKPDDPIEFFTELFAGLIITGMMEKNFISQSYKDTLVPAQEVKLTDKTFALIQPFMIFKPLHQFLGNNIGDKKLVLQEVIKKNFKGKGYEDIVRDDAELHGLSYALMTKFLLADYSVHDGNIGIKESTIVKEGKSKQLFSFVGFDFGAALRAIGSTVEAENIYTSLEEKNRLFNFYKKYPTLYANMPDLYVKIAQHANDIKHDINERKADFFFIVREATERAFISFKANFSQDVSSWIKVRDNLLNYVYGDKSSSAYADSTTLNDTDLIEKLALDLFNLIKIRAEKLTLDAAPQPLKMSRVKRYGSINGSAMPVQSMSETVNQTATSTMKILEGIKLEPDMACLSLTKNLHNTAEYAGIKAVGKQYAAPIIEPKKHNTFSVQKAQESGTLIRPIRG